MIISDLKSAELELYVGLNEKFGKVFEIAGLLMDGNPVDGRYDVDGDDFYYMIQTYDAKDAQLAQFETHRDYLDIQVVISGEEYIRFESVDKLTVTQEYTPDYALYAMNSEYDSVKLEKGEFAIIYPGEAHAPGIYAGGNEKRVVKMVAKIRV